MKTIFLFLFLIFSSEKLFAQVAGPNNPGTVTYQSAGCLSCPGTVWSTPTNVELADNQNSTTNLGAYPGCNQFNCYASRTLWASNFGFAIPANATINGIVVDIKKSAANSFAVKDSIVQLMWSSSNPIGQNKASSSFWGTTNAYTGYGSAVDLWGYAWTPLLLNSSSFTVSLKVQNTLASQQDANVDHIRVTVFYTLPNVPPVVNFSANDSTICAGSSVTFTDLSTNNPTSRHWTFTGGNPTTATSATQVVTYNNAGNFAVKLVATNASGSDSLTLNNFIHVDTIPVVSIVSLPDSVCVADASFTLNGSPNGGIFSGQGVSANNFTPPTAGVGGPYDIVYAFTDSHGCSANDTGMITVLPSPSVPTISISNDTLICNLVAASYQWFLAGNPISGATAQKYLATQNGVYTVMITNAAGCSATSGVFTVSGLSVENFIDENSFSIFPNPAEEKLFVNGVIVNGKQEIKISIIDFLGREIKSFTTNQESGITIQELPAGVYFVEVKTREGIATRKFVKE